MKNVNVIDIKPNTNITDFFMIKATSIKVGSNGKEYQDVVLTDATGDLSAEKWDVDENNIEFLKSLKVGDLVKVRGSVTDWKGQTQLRINQIRLATEEDELDMSDFVKSAPEKPIDMYEYIIGEINAMQDEDFKKLLREISKRFAIAGLVVIALGAAIIGFMYLFYGGIHQ